MRVVVIGGSGHIGTFLVPRLVRAGHDVTSVSRGARAPCTAAPEWQHVGNLDPEVWTTLSAGRPLRIPGTGVELMHHVHADDVAQAFELAVERRDAASGEDFNVVAPTALNVRGYAEMAAGWFGQEADVQPVSWEEFRRSTTAEHADASWGHLHRSQCFSIEKARSRLGYAPRYQPEAAVLESVRWLIEHGRLEVAHPLVPG